VAKETHPNDVAPVADGVQQPPLPTADAIALGQRGASRRRFARAGAGATGVLLTLASQPGMACDICMSASGYQSYSKTMTHASSRVEVICSGRGPSYWSQTGNWPSGCSASSLFGKHFECVGFSQYTYGSASCMKILTWQPQSVAAYMMAMYLNVLKGYTSFMTVEKVRAMWKEYIETGYYTPTAGVRWYTPQILFYLSGTMS